MAVGRDARERRAAVGKEDSRSIVEQTLTLTSSATSGLMHITYGPAIWDARALPNTNLPSVAQHMS